MQKSKYLSLKTFISLLFTAVIIIACKSKSGNQKEQDDSLQYYPPTPLQLTKEEFRNYYRKISTCFDTGLLKYGFNGGILIAKDGEVIYEKYTGKVDLRKSDTMSSTTSLHIASTSKTFTAIAILRLVQEGKLALNDSLEKFFPGIPYKGITIKMLLNHRSGLPNYLYFMSNNKWGILPNGKWNRQYATNNDVLQMMIAKRPDPTGLPDGRFSYCNTNFLMLALIIEKITGEPYPQYMANHFFTPLQMTHTYVFTLKDSLTATPTFTNTGTYWNYDFLDATYGDKNIYTTPRDLLKWDQALYTDQVINKSLLDSAFAPYSFEKPSIHNYGLGWRMQVLPNNKKIVYHFGKWHGSNAAFARLTDEKATIIILGNRFTRTIYEAANTCYNIFGDYYYDDKSDSDEIDSLKNTLLQRQSKKEKKRKR